MVAREHDGELRERVDQDWCKVASPCAGWWWLRPPALFITSIWCSASYASAAIHQGRQNTSLPHFQLSLSNP